MDAYLTSVTNGVQVLEGCAVVRHHRPLCSAAANTECASTGHGRARACACTYCAHTSAGPGFYRKVGAWCLVGFKAGGAHSRLDMLQLSSKLCRADGMEDELPVTSSVR